MLSSVIFVINYEISNEVGVNWLNEIANIHMDG